MVVISFNLSSFCHFVCSMLFIGMFFIPVFFCRHCVDFFRLLVSCLSAVLGIVPIYRPFVVHLWPVFSFLHFNVWHLLSISYNLSSVRHIYRMRPVFLISMLAPCLSAVRQMFDMCLPSAWHLLVVFLFSSYRRFVVLLTIFLSFGIFLICFRMFVSCALCDIY